MLIEGKDNIKAKRAQVWKFLTDAESVSKCTPGVESMEIIEPGKKFKAIGALGLGTVKFKFDTTIEWVEFEKARQGEDENERYRSRELHRRRK